MAELAAVEHGLDALEGRGGRLFDRAGCDCIRALVARAESLGGEAGRMLTERALEHLRRLEARFEAAQQSALGACASVCEPDRQRLTGLVRRGDIVLARRAVRRLAGLRTRSPSPRERRHRAAFDYEERVAELVAALALARAFDTVPEHAGPYNPLRIASDLLARMRAVSPVYLTVQLNRLEELASLLELPELPPRAPSALPSKKRKALKKGS